MLRAFCLGLFGLLSACTSDLTLRVPIDGRAESVVLGVEQRGSLRVYAFPAKIADGASHVPLQIPAGDEELTITALVYGVGLAALSLPEGQVPPASAGEETRPLPSEYFEAYRAQISGGDAGEWEMVETLGAMLAAFELAKPPAPPTICDRARVTTVPIENEEGLYSVALAGDQRAFALRSTARTMIGVARSGVPDEVDIPGANGSLIQAESDHRGTTYLSVFGGDILQLDDGGVVIVRGRVPMAAPQISIAADGRVFAYDGAQSLLLTKGSTVTGPGPELPPGTKSAMIIGDDRIAAITSGTIEVFDGASWRTELRDSRMGASATLFGDGAMFGVVQDEFGIAVRDEARREWIKLDNPVTAFVPYSGHALGGGRFVVGGDTGIVAIRLGEEWCRIETGTLRALQSFDLSADGRVLISASRDTNAQQSVVWFDL